MNRRRDLLHREEVGQLHGERHGRLCDATLHCSLQRRKLLLPTSYLPVDALPSGPMPERRTILVTDDSSANRDLLSGQLSNLGFWTEAANNGEEAIRVARRLKPDLILMDVEMPVMNGHEACKRLKADPSTAEIPVLMMTGFDPRPERAKMVEAGGSDLMAQPICLRGLRGRGAAPLRPKELRRP